MHLFDHLVEGIFLRRINRFVAEVLISSGNEVAAVHLANTGRMTELLVQDRPVLLRAADAGRSRKTKWSLFLIASEKGEWVCLQAAYANTMVAKWLQEEKIPSFEKWQLAKQEVKMGAHRFDFLLKHDHEDLVAEVKSVNFIVDGIARFPDAPTVRGCKHVAALTALQKEGLQTALIFVTMGQSVQELRMNRESDPAFSEAVLRARDAGVHMLVCASKFDRDGVALTGFVHINWEV